MVFNWQLLHISIVHDFSKISLVRHWLLIFHLSKQFNTVSFMQRITYSYYLIFDETKWPFKFAIGFFILHVFLYCCSFNSLFPLTICKHLTLWQLFSCATSWLTFYKCSKEKEIKQGRKNLTFKQKSHSSESFIFHTAETSE